jgi:mannose-6-phosphate isomerase
VSSNSATQHLRPLQFEPLFVPRIWGAHSLEPLYQRPAGAAPIGEVWLTGNECICRTPPFQSRKLAELWHGLAPDWAGARSNTAAQFPLLVKFLFPEDKLSVQVHPGDEYALQHEAQTGGTGKTEMWYVVAARQGAQIFAGLRSGTTPGDFRRKIEDGTVEECLNRVPVIPGEAIFIPAGTAHTIGPGSILCEIQENSDLTYRVFDYHRRNPDGTTRELHIEKALSVMNFGSQRGGKTPFTSPLGQNQNFVPLVADAHFAVERWELFQPMDLATHPERFELWVSISGRGNIHWGKTDPAHAEKNASAQYLAGEVTFIPAQLGAWCIEPRERSIFLRAFVPDLESYAKQLAACGISAEDAARVIFR